MEKVSSYNIKLLTFNWWELRDRYARYPIFMKFSIICTLCIYFCKPVRKCFKYVLQLQCLSSKLFGIDTPKAPVFKQ